MFLHFCIFDPLAILNAISVFFPARPDGLSVQVLSEAVSRVQDPHPGREEGDEHHQGVTDRTGAWLHGHHNDQWQNIRRYQDQISCFNTLSYRLLRQGSIVSSLAMNSLAVTMIVSNRYARIMLLEMQELPNHSSDLIQQLTYS